MGEEKRKRKRKRSEAIKKGQGKKEKRWCGRAGEPGGDWVTRRVEWSWFTETVKVVSVTVSVLPIQIHLHLAFAFASASNSSHLNSPSPPPSYLPPPRRKFNYTFQSPIFLLNFFSCPSSFFSSNIDPPLLDDIICLRTYTPATSPASSTTIHPSSTGLASVNSESL